jgi:hypothetical protein
MSEKDPIARMVVCAAASAAGPMGDNDAVWQAKVADIIPQIASMIRDEGAPAMKRALEVLDAEMFTSEYRGYDYEESSTRCLVHLWNVDHDKPERDLRTPRTNTRAGKVMRERLDRLDKGSRIMVYKALESTNDPEKKVRVLVNFDKLRQFTPRDGGGPSTPSRPPVLDGGDPPAASSAPDAAPAGGPIADALNNLTAKQLAYVARTARAEGIAFPTPETPHDRHRLEAIIDGAVNQF